MASRPYRFRRAELSLPIPCIKIQPWVEAIHYFVCLPYYVMAKRKDLQESNPDERLLDESSSAESSSEDVLRQSR